MLFHLLDRIRRLRLENKRLRHENRELRRKLKGAAHCIRYQSDRNWELLQWSRNKDAPASCRITERKELEV